MEEIRINKYLASVGVSARRKVDEMIALGKVKVNGKVATLGMKVNPDVDKIEVAGKKVGQRGSFKYIALYKPRGTVSTAQDEWGRENVVKLVGLKERVYPVGRLDMESEGLMLLTNDGELAFRLTHPSYHVSKTYIVDFLGDVKADKLEVMKRGVQLDDIVTKPTEVKVILKESGRTRLQIVLYEGRKRQIRRMAVRLHLHILNLKRVKIGNLELGGLGVGESRKLSEGEILNLKRLCKLN